MKVDSATFDFGSLIEPLKVRKLAVTITSASVDSSSPPNIGYMVEIFGWVKGHIRYVPDPTGIEDAQAVEETLELRTGDCEDQAILVASLCEAVGFLTALVHVESAAAGHMFAAIRCGELKSSDVAEAVRACYAKRWNWKPSATLTMEVQGCGGGATWMVADTASGACLGDPSGLARGGFLDGDWKWVRPDRIRPYWRHP